MTPDNPPPCGIIAQPISSGPPAVESTIDFCRRCGRAVWIAPSAQAAVASGFDLICIPCALSGGVQVADPPESVRGELE